MTAQEIAALSAAVSAAVLLIAAVFAWRQVVALRKATEVQMRPYVVVDLDWRDPPLIRLYVENIGRTIARDVRITFDPPLDSTLDEKDRKLSEIELLANPIPNLAPGKRYETLFDVSHQRAKAGLTDRFKVSTRYKGEAPGKEDLVEYKDETALAVSVLWGLQYTTVRSIKDIYNELDTLNKTLKSWSSGITRGSGIVVKRPVDLADEAEERRRARLERRRATGESVSDDLEGPPDLLSVNYEIQRLQEFHDRLLLLVNYTGDKDVEAINAFTEAFLVHFRNLLDFLSSKGGKDDIKATDFVPEFESTKAPEHHRERINKRLAHLSRSRVDYPKQWQFSTMLDEMREAWEEFVVAMMDAASEEE